MRLTLTAKIFITVVILGAAGAILYLNPGILGKLAPTEKDKVGSNVPPTASLPDIGSAGGAAGGGGGAFPPPPQAPAGCAQLPEVRFYHWAWNAQMGLMLATGGKQ